MARRGPAHHKPRKQKRGIQAAVRAPVRVVKRDAPMVQRVGAVGQSPTILAPVSEPRFPSVGSVDQGQAAWVYRGTFLHTGRSTKHEQRVLVYCSRAELWSAGEAMAKRGVSKFFDLRLQAERPPGHLHDYALLGVACEGQYNFQTNTVHPDASEGYR